MEKVWAGWWEKGEWLSPTFRPPRLWPARLWKRFAECFAIAPPWAGERLVAAFTFHSPRLWPARLWKRFTECFAIAPPWVRARGAHCKTVCTRSVSHPLVLPLTRGLRGRAPRQWHSIRLARRRPSPKAPRQWRCIRFALGRCAAVLQCAPCARTKGRGTLRIRQSASKDGAVGEWAGKGL